MDKYYNERNEFDDELYEIERRKSKRRLIAILAALSLVPPTAEGIALLTREELTLNGIKLVKGNYDTLYNPKTNDVAILTGRDAAGNKVDSNYCYDAISNKIVPISDYEKDYFDIDLMKMVKDGSIESSKTGINKFTVSSKNIDDAARVQLALNYLSNEEATMPELSEEESPKFNLMMLNDLSDDYVSVLLDPVYDLALYNNNTEEFTYVHLDRDDTYDLFTGNKVDLSEFVGSSGVDVFDLVEKCKIDYVRIPEWEDTNKDLLVINASDLISRVYYEKGGHVMSIGGR